MPFDANIELIQIDPFWGSILLNWPECTNLLYFYPFLIPSISFMQLFIMQMYVRVVLNSFTRKRTSSPNKKFSFAKLSPYPCLTLAVHQASIEQHLGQMSHRNFSVVAAHSDSMFLHSILVLAHLHRPVLTLPRPNCSTHLLQRSLLHCIV